MIEVDELKMPEIRVVDDDFEIEFGIEITIKADERDGRDSLLHEIANKSSAVNEKLLLNNQKLDKLNAEIDRLTNKADGLDYMVAVASGILAGIVDSLWVGEFSMERGKAWSNKNVNEFVMKAAKSQGYEGDRLTGAIEHLENKFKIPSDNLWSGKDVGISARSHHLDDLAHHPTPIGLFFSIITQFTRKGYFQNKDGDFIPITIDENGEGLIGHNFPSKIFAGTLNWFFHLVSDMSGSKKTAGAGMGIPGPIVSVLKELSTLPGVNKTGLPKKLHEVFVKQKFDLRSELAVGYEVGRQSIPIILNEVIVRAFYFIRRLTMEIKEKTSINEIDWRSTLPFKNRTIARMITISSGTFTVVDIVDAAIRGGIKSGGNSVIYAKEFLLRVNFVGVGRFAIAVSTDLSMGVKRNSLRNERMLIMSEQLHLKNAQVFYKQSEMWIAAEKTEDTINEAMLLMENTTVFFMNAMEDNFNSLEKIASHKDAIDEHDSEIIDEINDILKWG